MIGDSGKSALQIMEKILLEENKAMYEKDDFSVRITRQMELPIELAGPSIDNSRNTLNPELLGGISLAFQGFVTFLPKNDKVLQIDWDESQLPTFKRVQKAFKSELNKPEALRDVISTAAVGCLLPDLTNMSDDMNVDEVTVAEGNKDDAWELKKRFMNTRQIYHESWLKHQKATYEEYKEDCNPMFMRMLGDTHSKRAGRGK